jgi:putative transcriptional regulator
MTITHHPSDATLVAYVSGGLGEALALVVATHIALCSDCRRKAGAVEAVGGALLDDLPPAPMSEHAFAKLLPLLGAIEEKPARISRLAVGRDFQPPAPLRDYVGPSLSEKNWRFLAPGIGRIAVVPRSRRGVGADLLRIKPGTGVAHHGHGGTELTMILGGGYTDEIGHFVTGDFVELDGNIRHRPVADPGEDCICLVAAGKTRFTGFLGKLLQPFIRI